MKTLYSLILLHLVVSQSYICAQHVNLELQSEFRIDETIGSLRAVPVTIQGRHNSHILLVYSREKEVDPYEEMFYFYKHPLVFALIDQKGNLIWKREHHMGIVPGVWFCPVFPFDRDSDGTDEIYYASNADSVHLFAQSQYGLEELDVTTGKTTGRYPWEGFGYKGGTGLGMRFRYFVLGGYVENKPILVTALGTYGKMQLQAWNADMSKRWELIIDDNGKGPRGSHMCPVVDIDLDGNDDLMWGERCISLATGQYIFIADESLYAGHSDVIQPVFDPIRKQWAIFTCRETGGFSPRVVTYNNRGERLWFDLDEGHMDIGWVAHLRSAGSFTALAVKIGKKVAGPDGFFRSNTVEYIYDFETGRRDSLPFEAFSTIPVDINGDGVHELICARGEQGNANLYDADGQILANIGTGGIVAMASKFIPTLAGEQLLCYYPDGTIRIWYDKNAKDSNSAQARYNSSFYKRNQRLTATGYNLMNLGGI